MVNVLFTSFWQHIDFYLLQYFLKWQINMLSIVLLYILESNKKIIIIFIYFYYYNYTTSSMSPLGIEFDLIIPHAF